MKRNNLSVSKGEYVSPSCTSISMEVHSFVCISATTNGDIDPLDPLNFDESLWTSIL